MTKRKNPFDDSHFLQKLHVGVKEVNLGVNHVENMKKVYESTMKMLFNGSVSSQNGLLKLQNGISHIQRENSVLQNGIYHADHKAANGILQWNKNAISNKQDKNMLINPCCSSNMTKQCFFCERIMCTICQRMCQSCNNEFCHLCSILQYDSQEETAICLSCM